MQYSFSKEIKVCLLWAHRQIFSQMGGGPYQSLHCRHSRFQNRLDLGLKEFLSQCTLLHLRKQKHSWKHFKKGCWYGSLNVKTMPLSQYQAHTYLFSELAPWTQLKLLSKLNLTVQTVINENRHDHSLGSAGHTTSQCSQNWIMGNYGKLFFVWSNH